MIKTYPSTKHRSRFPHTLENRLILLILFNLAVIIILTVLGYYSLKISAGARAYTNEEGLWSKSEKAAVISLLRYAQSGDEVTFDDYYNHLAVPLGDKEARQELEKEEPDLEAVRRGFVQGSNHPDDVDDLIWLYRRFRHAGYGERIVAIWEQKDGLVERLIKVAQEVRQARRLSPRDEILMESLISEVHSIDDDLTDLEDAFSSSLGEATREMNRLALYSSLGSGIAFFLMTAFASFLLARRIRRGISRLQTGAKRVSEGDYTSRVKISHQDELGNLAQDFNWMAGRLERVMEEIRASGESLQRSEAELRRYTEELKRSNKELEQFAYVASHDLREPLTSIGGFSKLLAQRYRDKLDERAQEFIDFIVNDTERMQHLISDLLDYSRVATKEQKFDKVDSGAVLSQVLRILDLSISESGAVITATDLPVITADEIQLGQLFQNLLSNAIKFRGDKPPRIHIEALEQPDAWLFSFRDEGIGVAPANQQRIFQVFQRAHARDEYPGTGIGLAICKRIVERHGGRIWVEAEEGKGSTFFFTLAKLIPNAATGPADLSDKP